MWAGSTQDLRNQSVMACKPPSPLCEGVAGARYLITKFSTMAAGDELPDESQCKDYLACVESAWSKFENALTAALDPCAPERTVVRRREADDTSGEFLDDDGPYLSALWQCERSRGGQTGRLCVRARAESDSVYKIVKRFCGAECVPEMNAAQACAKTFGKMERERLFCVQTYQPVQEAARKACEAGAVAAPGQ